MRSFVIGCSLVIVSLAAAGTARAQAAAPPPPKLGPTNSTDLGLVIATGNARSTSVGLRNVYGYRWANAQLRWEGGWLRVATRDGHRYAVGTTSNFNVVEPGLAVASERLFSKLGYQHQITMHTDWFSNFDAVRDEPLNISHQVVLAGGLGTTWWKTDKASFRTAYGVTYTNEDLVVEGVNQFGGYRLYYGLKAPVAATSTFESELTFDGSFKTGNDVRTDWLNGLSVAINSKLALKSSVRMLFRNLPALEALDLRSADGIRIGAVDVNKEKVDTNITTSLVITF